MLLMNCYIRNKLCLNQQQPNDKKQQQQEQQQKAHKQASKPKNLFREMPTNLLKDNTASDH